VKNLLEITTPPSANYEDLARNYLRNLSLAIEVASQIGLELYPLGTYPLPISPELRDDPGYDVQARTLGQDRFLHAGRCAGAHLHLELPPGTVWPDVKTALVAPIAAKEELLNLYNLATALDPALVALTRGCPFYEGQAVNFAARTVYYRGMLGSDGLYANLQEVGALSAYAIDVRDFLDLQEKRYAAWYAAMDSAGVDRRLFASTRANLHRASWNPIRLSPYGTLEIRSMDANFPKVILAVCALVCAAAERLRREQLRVRPAWQVRSLEVVGDRLLVPRFSYLSGELLGTAVTRGVLDERIATYLDALVEFAGAYIEQPELVEALGYSGGGYKTTELDVLRSLPPVEDVVSRGQALRLVRRSCRRLREQVSSLLHKHHGRGLTPDWTIATSSRRASRAGRQGIGSEIPRTLRSAAVAGEETKETE
jgi:gamma-glutamyl:cysteine ligase YbdK (ATP-grasp superfamily)